MIRRRHPGGPEPDPSASAAPGDGLCPGGADEAAHAGGRPEPDPDLPHQEDPRHAGLHERRRQVPATHQEVSDGFV